MKYINKEALARNERVVYFGDWEHGFFSMAIVGAYNVGSIEINFDKTLLTNTGVANSETPLLKELKKGDEIGCFHMGSAIILVFEAPPNFNFIENSQVSLGQSILLSK